MLPITITEYKDIISKARILKSQIDNQKLDANLVKDFIEFLLATAPENFNTTKLTKEQIKEMFKDYLITEQSYLIKTGKYEHYWDRDEDLDSKSLEKILEKANVEKIDTFANATEYYIFENNMDIEWEDINSFIDEFYEKYSDKAEEIKDVLNGDDYPILSDVFYENIKYDLDVETLLRHSAPDDLTVYFGQDWDDEYSDIEADFVECFDKPEFLTNERDTPIDWLMSTQGYTREDLISEEKRKQSKFLTSLYKELFDYMIGLEGCQLIAIPSSDDFEAILNLSRRKNVKINKSTNFGFFNRIHGSGCELSIELEKDIIINEKSPIYEVTMAYTDSFGNYSPDAVYGLVRSRYGNDLKVLNNEQEEK